MNRRVRVATFQPQFAVVEGGDGLYRLVATADSRHPSWSNPVGVQIPPSAPDLHVCINLVYFLYLMWFEFDPAKSAANQVKHGIEFVEAQALWSDPNRIEGPGRSTDEPRVQIVGQIGETIWTATVTYRHEETIRIISVRHARADEEARYLEGQGEMGYR